MRQVRFDARGSMIRWTEAEAVVQEAGGAAGAEAGAAGTGAGVAATEPIVFVHGLGASSAAYHAHIAARPELTGRRILFVDLPGHGLSDRPADFAYRLTDHADALAAVLDAAGVRQGVIAGHSMGGSVAIVLAHHRPDLVGRLVITEGGLDRVPPHMAGSGAISAFTEKEFVRGGGFARILDQVGPVWAATMRLTDPVALHRTATHRARGTDPVMREMLEQAPMERVYLQGALSGELPGRTALEAAGVRVLTAPDAGHNVMFDNPEFFARAVAGAER
ncbi:alpha/beta fold hydrolase [Streptomyces sp. KLOTTS4A1]|uniref:alpha/beta fold hydrolase n=1 Tax=Streptomyces sp. KLOTTS4A1 TaxID=3390996 RepID=UPI0039F5E3D5